jgi:hypothetical protein
MSSSARIALLHGGSERSFACWLPEDDEGRVIAGLKPPSSAITRVFFEDLLAENGAPYGVWVFGGLPSLTINHRPDLLDAEVFKRSYWRWMQSRSARDPAIWASLRDGIIGASVEPIPMHRGLQLLRQLKEMGTPPTPEAIQHYLNERRQEGDEIASSERRLILDNYFAVNYREMVSGRY